MLLIPRAAWIAGGAVAALVMGLRSRRVVNGLQVIIAKGRKHKRRNALQGNYGPVSTQIFQQECEVVAGQLPQELDGIYMRNGSNPIYEPYASYHWFEGDGCVHATRIKDGKASFCNHFVQTHRFKEEQRARFPIYAKFGDQEGLRGMFVALLELLKQKTGIIRGAPVAECGTGTANTSLVYHAGRLLALHEGDLPYQPYLQYGVLSPNGSLIKSFPINVPFPSMFHDFAITEHYAVFLHMPLVFDPKAMIEIVWYELPAFYVFHIANAWEDEQGRVRMFACQAPRVDLNAMVFNEELGSRLTEYVVDPQLGTAHLRRVSEVVGDFPLVHPAMYGKPTRYAYIAMTDTADPTAQIKGIAKLDLTTPAGVKEAAVATIEYEGFKGGEAFFVPRSQDPEACSGEDDGFLLVYCFDPSSDCSYLMVYDAKTMSSVPLAQVKLPQRVPHGFHTTWVTAQQIKDQVLPGMQLQ
eukprot:gene11168-11318_t